MRDVLMFGVVFVYLVYGAPIASEFGGAPAAFGAVFLLLVTWMVSRAVSMIREDRSR